ncbi:hypothetical protein Drorol1_Dr00021956 [Drosera rotundifolia]
MLVNVQNSTRTGSGEASVSSNGDELSPPPAKKRRNQAGMPDPDAEVIALSPTTLMATNRFVCEICNKGFQRDQNLQLHRRGHNLPWKLRQRSSKEVRKRVYVCPEKSCVHHDPARALGDLTGIKKHFCRKHGEKKWKCEKCSKKYAVLSDWKAHSKICGSREYKCDCGAPFSRRDSFTTHRAFCDALAEESTKTQTKALQLPPSKRSGTDRKLKSSVPMQPPPIVSSTPPQPQQPLPQPQPEPEPKAQDTSPLPLLSHAQPLASPILPIHNPVTELGNNNPTEVLEDATTRTTPLNVAGSTSNSNSSPCSGSTNSGVFASLFAQSSVTGSLPTQSAGFSDLMQAIVPQDHQAVDIAPSSSADPFSLRLATSSLFNTFGQEHRQFMSSLPPAMSATALLHKAVQMGAKVSSGSLLCGLELVSSSSSLGQAENSRRSSGRIEPEIASVPSGLGLGLHCDEGSGLKELLMGSTSLFGPKPATLDFLGLGMVAAGSPNVGLSALITSIGGGLSVAAATSIGDGDFAGQEVDGNSMIPETDSNGRHHLRRTHSIELRCSGEIFDRDSTPLSSLLSSGSRPLCR